MADYGNGKTNLMKYLDLYLKTYKNNSVYFSYFRADIEVPDIFLNLLKVIQTRYLNPLINSILKLRTSNDIDEFYEGNCYAFDNNFADIKEYTKTLFDRERTEDEVRELIFLGSGRLYTKRDFGKFKLQQLTDYNRREILALFLNILSANNIYIIFAIDELEKIQEKSKARFRNFLTTFRELIDLSGNINGITLLTIRFLCPIWIST